MTSKFMLAYTGDLGVLDRDDMVGEVKEDGTRNHIIKTPTSLQMWSRNSETNQYQLDYAQLHNLPEVEHDVNKLNCGSIWLDVELVWYNRQGRSIMRGSQVRCGTKRPDAVREKMRFYFIHAMSFDLLELNGIEYVKEPFVVRKAVLEQFLKQHKDLTSLRYLPYTADKRQLWKDQLSIGGEGIMAKTLTHRYEFRRSRQWLKLRNERITIKQVVGYTLGKGARAPYFASLVLMNDDGAYAGNVGNGFDTQELERWTQRLRNAPAMAKPFPDRVVGESYIAVKIPLKVKVRYFETTANGRLRFPVYLDEVA